MPRSGLTTPLRRTLQAVLAVVSLSMPAKAADTVMLKVGYGPGGGYDTIARFVAEHLGNHLPGRPDILVQNVAGAGSLKLAKMMVGSEPADGSVIALINSSIAVATVTQPEIADFDANSINWIGSMNETPSVCIVPNDSPIKTVEDFLGADILVGSSGKTSATYVMAALLKNALGARFKLVTGFKGGAEINLAMERGEIGARCGNSLTSYHATGADKTMRLVGQWTFNAPAETKHLPNFLDLIDNDSDRAAAALVIGNLAFDNPLLLPPGTPASIVAEFRAAFDAMVASPEFKTGAVARGIDLSPKPGTEVAEIVRRLTEMEKPVIDRAGELSQ